METIASRELRNHTAEALKKVQAGASLTITVNGRPAALLTPVRGTQRRWISRDDLIERLKYAQADPGLRADLARLALDTTDDLW